MKSRPQSKPPGDRGRFLPRILLRLFPRDFREEHGEEWLEMAQASSTSKLIIDTASALLAEFCAREVRSFALAAKGRQVGKAAGF